MISSKQNVGGHICSVALPQTLPAMAPMDKSVSTVRRDGSKEGGKRTKTFARKSS